MTLSNTGYQHSCERFQPNHQPRFFVASFDSSTKLKEAEEKEYRSILLDPYIFANP